MYFEAKFVYIYLVIRHYFLHSNSHVHLYMKSPKGLYEREFF
jgi:hypothetical protein